MPLGFGNKSYGEPWQYKVPHELLAKASKPESLSIIDALTNAIDEFKKKRLTGTQQIPIVGMDKYTGEAKQIGGYEGMATDKPMITTYNSKSSTAGLSYDDKIKLKGFTSQSDLMDKILKNVNLDLGRNFGGTWDSAMGQWTEMQKNPEYAQQFLDSVRKHAHLYGVSDSVEEILRNMPNGPSFGGGKAAAKYGKLQIGDTFQGKKVTGFDASGNPQSR